MAGLTIEAVPAYNLVHKRDNGEPFHPKGQGNGYVITFGDKRVYVAGDTENTPEMKALKGIDIAFLPMNLPYTMTPEMVADAVRAFKPKVLYPYHFGKTDTAKLAALLQSHPEIELRLRQAGVRAGRAPLPAKNPAMIYTTQRGESSTWRKIFPRRSAISSKNCLSGKIWLPVSDEFRWKQQDAKAGAIPVPSRPAVILQASPGILKRGGRGYGRGNRRRDDGWIEGENYWRVGHCPPYMLRHVHPALKHRQHAAYQELHMTELTIRADELIMAFEDYGTESQYFFNRRGSVVPIEEDMHEDDFWSRWKLNLIAICRFSRWPFGSAMKL